MRARCPFCIQINCSASHDKVNGHLRGRHRMMRQANGIGRLMKKLVSNLFPQNC
ncbi:hypothetical protein BCEP27_60353 [Burkholderia cepacia]